MVVSILHFVVDLPDIGSIKEKRQIVQSIKGRLQNKFKISVAEVDLQDSWRFAEIGVAVVSNSKQYGESILHKALHFAENFVPGRIRDTAIFSEIY
ncbi:MAG: DUF503 domain-containing protein [Spirochaetales bacterium]|nr:DUF503 domain-containing protein [Spirochaetales bacterium]